MRAWAGLVLGLSLLGGWPALASAQSVAVHGYVDLRAVNADEEPSWIEGGLGKLRWGGKGSVLGSPSAAMTVAAQLAPEWLAFTTLQAQPDSHAAIETQEAWVRYRPVSTTPWRWSVRAGAFFPAVSLENDALGWTSPYGITPSAINSWVGEELRSTGLEWRLERRGRTQTFSSGLTLFEGNDPAGEQLAARGWSLSDRVQGLGGRLREPDITARNLPPPRDFDPFVENDHRFGWHADLTLNSQRFGRWQLMRYDNRADPTTFRVHDGERVFSWHTRFWSLGQKRALGPLTLVSQAMLGSTTFKPSPNFTSTTRFWSGYVLLARSSGVWRPSLRIDAFGTRELPREIDQPANEHGHAVTAALNWRPMPWLRVSGEMIRLDSSRTSRTLADRPERSVETQAQLSLRLFF